MTSAPNSLADRASVRARALRLEYVSIGWHVVEGGLAITAADAFQATACLWLSVITLAGIGINALTGWWWADPVAALGMTPILILEGREAWRGKVCCDLRGRYEDSTPNLARMPPRGRVARTSPSECSPRQV